MHRNDRNYGNLNLPLSKRGNKISQKNYKFYKNGKYLMRPELEIVVWYSYSKCKYFKCYVPKDGNIVYDRGIPNNYMDVMYALTVEEATKEEYDEYKRRKKE